MSRNVAQVGIDKQTGRPVGDHGTGTQALDWVLNHCADEYFGDSEKMDFLRAWYNGGGVEEWPDFYVWLAKQPNG